MEPGLNFKVPDPNGFDPPDAMVIQLPQQGMSDSEKLDLILARMTAIEEMFAAVKPKVEEGLAQVGPMVKAIEEMPLVRSLLRVKK